MITINIPSRCYNLLRLSVRLSPHILLSTQQHLKCLLGRPSAEGERKLRNTALKYSCNCNTSSGR